MTFWRRSLNVTVGMNETWAPGEADVSFIFQCLRDFPLKNTCLAALLSFSALKFWSCLTNGNNKNFVLNSAVFQSNPRSTRPLPAEKHTGCPKKGPSTRFLKSLEIFNQSSRPWTWWNTTNLELVYKISWHFDKNSGFGSHSAKVYRIFFQQGIFAHYDVSLLNRLIDSRKNMVLLFIFIQFISSESFKAFWKFWKIRLRRSAMGWPPLREGALRPLRAGRIFQNFQNALKLSELTNSMKMNKKTTFFRESMRRHNEQKCPVEKKYDALS